MKEKTADELFKELGYEIIVDNGTTLNYKYKKEGAFMDKEIVFGLIYKVVYIELGTGESANVNMQELQVINKKVEELRMDLEKFMELLSKAKKDRYGNLYVERKDVEDCSMIKDLQKQRYYFSLSTTVCDDLVKEYAHKEKEGFEIYDRHSWNDDTLEIKIVREKNKNHD